MGKDCAEFPVQMYADRRVVGQFGNGKLTPSPVAPATGRLCCFSARRQVPAYRRQATGLSGKINIVKLTPLPTTGAI
jgi:hypothetical protein